MVGSPADTTGFAALADACASRFTVVTYDPRGIGNSSRDDASTDVTPGDQAEDLAHLITAFGGGPVDMFGSSGGATVGLALVAVHPELVGTLVAHEPPVMTLLDDREALLSAVDDIYETFRADGPSPAMRKFAAMAGFQLRSAEGSAPPPPEEGARMAATLAHFLGHLLRPTAKYSPDITALSGTSTRIVVAAGATSAGQLAHRAAEALAAALGTTIFEFPDGHIGYATSPAESARVLEQVLAAG
jgi:pimeloyl-ACP methyl ester carboxylesterase